MRPYYCTLLWVFSWIRFPFKLSTKKIAFFQGIFTLSNVCVQFKHQSLIYIYSKRDRQIPGEVAALVYITEHGIFSSVGYFRVIDSSP